MIARQLSWQDQIQHSLARERESDAFARTADDDPESTYWTRDDVEYLHTEFGQKILRELSDEEIGLLGGIAGPPAVGIVRRDFASGDSIEQGIVRIISATVQSAAQNPFVPVDFKSLAEWVQLEGAAAKGYYTLFAGTVQFQGWRLRLTYLVEPQLEDFESNAVLLPPAGYIEPACDWVHHQLTVADWLPVGRA